MKTAIMQPYFFPYIGYFQLINAADKFIILDDVNYINKGWINRNNILVNNKKTLFTLPLKNASQNKLINEVSISEDKKWSEKFLKTIMFSYKKAPFFSETFFLIEKILNFENELLSFFLYNSIKKTCAYLEINTEIIETSVGYNSKFKADDKIIDICKKENTNTYINPIGGQKLYSREKFMQNGINLFFLQTNEIKYKQFHVDFIPFLSIIDLMMFNSVSEIKNILDNFELR